MCPLRRRLARYGNGNQKTAVLEFSELADDVCVGPQRT